MRCIIVLLALSALAAAGPVSGVGGRDPGIYPGLTAEQRAAIETTNQHHLEKMDIWAHKNITAFLKAVKANDAVVRLGNGIRGGHSIMYEFVEGPKGAAAKIPAIARKAGLSVLPSRQCKCTNCCGRLILPGQRGKTVRIVEAGEVAGQRQKRKGPPTVDKVEPLKQLNRTTPHEQTVQEAQDKQRTRFNKLSPDQVTWYHDNNLAQISKMHAEAQPFVKKFIEDLKTHAPKTVIHFMEPVLNGHTVRFTHVLGSLAPVARWANQCGLVLKGRTLTAPTRGPKGKPVTPHAVNAEVVKHPKSHIEVDTNEQFDNGSAKPLHHVEAVVVDAHEPITVDGTAPHVRHIVKDLPDKWINTPTKMVALLEEDDSLMELYEQADRAADDLADF